MEFEIRVRAKRITARENEVRLKLKISAIVLCFFFFLAKQMRNESAKCVLECVFSFEAFEAGAELNEQNKPLKDKLKL